MTGFAQTVVLAKKTLSLWSSVGRLFTVAVGQITIKSPILGGQCGM